MRIQRFDGRVTRVFRAGGASWLELEEVLQGRRRLHTVRSGAVAADQLATDAVVTSR